MDSPVQPIASRDFRTPPRILIPKLVHSRDRWKAKATTRKCQHRKEKIRSRDLAHSRRCWKGRARDAEQELQELRQQLQRAQADLAEAHSQIAELQDDLKKS
jgi:chromosome segregation ATPase